MTSSSSSSFDALHMLQIKRQNARPHTTEELTWWIQEYSSGNIPEYQMAAWLMAVCWQGMTPQETATLCHCMVQSGTVLEWEHVLPKSTIPKVDKHSTGGVGDKISIVLAPLVATLGVAVPMMAGRGLGHTGGTIDKLESIPGYQTCLPITKFQEVVAQVGCSIVAASSEICLADRKLYALRDVTATVSCIPLQTSSIMCKKIAEHPDSLVLDVKYGTASFQSTMEDAHALATSMIQTGEANGLLPTTCFLTHMDSIIGTSVGNWLEIQECVLLLKTGQGAPDLIALIVMEAAQMLFQSSLEEQHSFEEWIDIVHETLTSGKAFEKFEQMVQAHGGDVSVFLDNNYPSQPQLVQEIQATKSGILQPLDGLAIGNLCVQLGAGRLKAEDPVDPLAGMEFLVRPGVEVQKDQVLVRVQTNSRSQQVLDKVCQHLQDEILIISDDVPTIPFPVSHKVTSQDGLVPLDIPPCLKY